MAPSSSSGAIPSPRILRRISDIPVIIKPQTKCLAKMRSAEENRARTIVVVEWVLLALWTLLMVIVMIYCVEDLKERFTGGELNAAWLGLIVLALFGAILNGILTNGVREGHLCSCRTWYIITIILAVLWVYWLVLSIAAGDIFGFIFWLLALAYRIYAIKIIMDYTTSLTSSSGSVNKQQQRGPVTPTAGARDPPVKYETKKGNVNVNMV